MGSIKLVTLLLLSSVFAIEGKAISKRYVEHLLREGYTSDCGETAQIAPSPLPTIIAARAQLSPISYAEPTPISYAEPTPLPYEEPAPISYPDESGPISYAESGPISYTESGPISYAESAPISYAESIPCDEPAPITYAEPMPISYAEPTPISYAEPLPIIAENKPSAAFGYEFTVPIPPTPLEAGKVDNCGPSAPIMALPAPVELPAPATTITTDCHGIPTLPLAPPPAELPIPSPAPEELPPADHEGPHILTEPLKTCVDCGVEVAAAPLFDDLPSAPAPHPLEMPIPSPPTLTIEGPALPEHDEGCHGTTTYAAPFMYGPPQADLTHLPEHQWEEEYKDLPATYSLYGGLKSLPLIQEGYEKKALAGFRYGMPQLHLNHWNSPTKMLLMKRKPLLIRTGISHPILSTGLEGYKGKIITPQHDLIHLAKSGSFKGDWHHLPMYRTGVSHPFLSAKAK